MVADWPCTREKGKDFFIATMAIAHRVRGGAARPKVEGAEAPDRAPKTLETVPPLDGEVLATLVTEVREPTAWDELRGVGNGGAPMQSPLRSPEPGTERRMSHTSSGTSTASSSSETVAARRRANRQRLLGPDGVFVGECKGGFCSTNCSRCAPRRRLEAAGPVAGQAAQPSARA
ncbi:unnamed protein product [Prorocentrum cordatum]|uniref:Uncharacterized protein n=1 Tax=Prorocentrum cordatum TaxID=2364126 RepID=A0ABN9T0C0_9DINO|nr:unnamed protein product [Polarella glacialis]